MPVFVWVLADKRQRRINERKSDKRQFFSLFLFSRQARALARLSKLCSRGAFCRVCVRREKSFSLRVPRKIVIAFGRDQDPLGGVLLFISDPGDITNDLVGRRVIRKVIKGELHFPPGIGRHHKRIRENGDESRQRRFLCVSRTR